MYVKKEALKELELLHGRPLELNWQQDITNAEMAMLRASQKNGRSHDFTFFIMDKHEEQLVVIRKHQHPPGFYRAPSGGSEPGEDIIKGIRREALEETGLKINLKDYILRFNVIFQNEDIRVPWVSHVLTAFSTSNILCPLDTKEIKEAKWVSWVELQGSIRNNLRTSSLGLLHYRVALTDTVVGFLNKGSLIV